MELSEAILKGCTIRPQGQGSFFSMQERDHEFPWLRKKDIFTSCALGAAIEGLWGEVQLHWNDYAGRIDITESSVDITKVMSLLVETFPTLHEKMRWDGLDEIHRNVVDPDYLSIKNVIFVLNDKKGWTREQIAAWVKYVVEGQPMIPEEV